MEPSIGRIVHYVSFGAWGAASGQECLAAIVTEVTGRAVKPPDMTETDLWVAGLAVLGPDGLFFRRGVVQMEDGHDTGTWHWPERVHPVTGRCDA
jgi:hypothetical protein